jgi:hypothetical protein
MVGFAFEVAVLFEVDDGGWDLVGGEEEVEVEEVAVGGVGVGFG